MVTGTFYACLFLMTDLLLIQCQVIKHGSSCKDKYSRENDIWTKIQELHIEYSRNKQQNLQSQKDLVSYVNKTKTKRRRSDPVLWQKPLYQQKCQRDKVTTQSPPQKCSIKQQLRTDLGRSVGVTTVTQLVWLTGLRVHLPTPRNSRVIKRTHI